MAHSSTRTSSSSSSDSEVDSSSKSCVKAYATLKEQYDSLSSDYKKSQFNLVSYKVGLQSVEDRLVHYMKNKAVFGERINVLNLEVKLRDIALVENKKKLEKAEKERDELKLKLEKFQNSSKSLNNLLEGQVSDKLKIGLRYNAATSAVESFMNSSEIEYMDVVSNVASSDVKTVESKHETVDKGVFNTVESNTIRKNNFSPLIVEELVSDNDLDDPSKQGRKIDKEERQTISKAEGLIQELLQKIFKLKDQEDEVFQRVLSK
ncbi:hypothetical protein Tco_1293771 [Tanacetum coccineum]